MKGWAREISSEARELRASGQLATAGWRYTLSAYEHAGEMTEAFPEPGNVQAALGMLLHAATCYRIVGDQFRTQNRCDLGALIVKEHRSYVEKQDVQQQSFAALRRGAWPEFLGDFKVIAGSPGADAAYDEAIATYDAAGDAPFAFGEQEHMRLAAYFRHVRCGLREHIPEEAPEHMGPNVTFTEWIEYKRNRLPELLDELESRGDWPVE